MTRHKGVHRRYRVRPAAGVVILNLALYEPLARRMRLPAIPPKILFRWSCR